MAKWVGQRVHPCHSDQEAEASPLAEPRGSRQEKHKGKTHEYGKFECGASRHCYRGQQFLGTMFNHWKRSGVVTVGSGRPLDERVSGDPNQDDNSSNDRLPGFRRNAFLGPDYATTDMRVKNRGLVFKVTYWLNL